MNPIHTLLLTIREHQAALEQALKAADLEPAVADFILMLETALEAQQDESTKL